MTTLKAGLELTARDRASNTLDKVRRQMGSLNEQGKRLKTSLASLGKTWGKSAAVRLGAAGAGMLGAYGAAQMIKGAMNIERRLAYLGVAAEASSAEIGALYEQIKETAEMGHIKVDSEQMVSAVEEIVERTGDLEFAKNNLEAIGMTISATGATGFDIGGIVAEFQKMGITDILPALDMLTKQGKAGAFTMQQFARLGGRLLPAYAATGRSGLEAVRELGALAQIARMGAGSAEQATTALENIFATLSDAKKLEMLKQAGINVYEQDGETLRAVPDLLQEIIKAADEAPAPMTEVLSQIFGAEAIRAINYATGKRQKAKQEGKDPDSVDVYAPFMAVEGDGETLKQDSATIAATALSQVESATDKMTNALEAKVVPPLQEIAQVVSRQSDENAENAITRGLGGATVGGVLAAAAPLFIPGVNVGYTAATLLGLAGALLVGGGSAATAFDYTEPETEAQRQQRVEAKQKRLEEQGEFINQHLNNPLLKALNSQSNITITFENLPEGAQAKAASASGAKINVNRGLLQTGAQ